ncbi:MAG: 1-deoxy-D-xylulose-5-phosphate reductoisomerase [Clostridia bacterium]
MKNIALLGASGSIGKQTLDVLRMYPDKFKLISASVNSDIAAIEAIVKEFNPEIVGVLDTIEADKLFLSISGTDIVSGSEAASICATFDSVDIVVNAVAGFDGIFPFLEAVKAGKTIAAVNKESIVCSHGIINKEGGIAFGKLKNGAKIIPIDSEQSAIFKCAASGVNVKKLILTASGGPFFGYTAAELSCVTLEDTLKHPTWKMGKKITIDSATMFNKGLEIIEAAYLFGTENIDVLVHPKSIVHSIVEFDDGSLIAEMYNPNMRLPIQYALTYPEKLKSEVPELDLSAIGKLEFFKPDEGNFPALRMARDVLKRGGGYPIAYNAANEVAVGMFINGSIGFLDISRCVEFALSKFKDSPVDSLEGVLIADRETRKIASSFKK